jgi:ABC-type nitrate/sulfonate/bicarbonate transport system substrate-binding protein
VRFGVDAAGSELPARTEKVLFTAEEFETATPPTTSAVTNAIKRNL